MAVTQRWSSFGITTADSWRSKHQADRSLEVRLEYLLGEPEGTLPVTDRDSPPTENR